MSKKYISALSLLLAALLLGGCAAQSIAPAENVYTGNYSLTTHQQSADITVDGVLDEAAWQGKNWFTDTYANSDGTAPVLELTAFPTQQGVYIGSVVYDTNLTSDGQRYPNVNSNWELYLAACNVDEQMTDEDNRGKWNMHRIYVDMRGESMSLYTNTERVVTVDGELNSGATNSATLELFVAWETLGVDVSKGVPETVSLLPCYRAVLIAGSATTYMFPAGADLNAPSTYHLFDKNGYTCVDADGAMLGNAQNGYSKSGGWDLSQLDKGIVEQTYSGQGFIYFTEQQGENFIVEATVIPVCGVNDSWPKAGICFQQADGLWYTVMLDPLGTDTLVESINGTKNFPEYRIVTLDQHDGNWNQYTLSGYDRTFTAAATQEGVRLTVVKYGNNLWYFADGKYLTGQTVSWLEGACYPGLFTLGFDVVYKDFSCKAIDFDDLGAYLNTGGIYVASATVDGKGGEVSVDKTTFAGGEDVQLHITTNTGYRLSSVTVNGSDLTDTVRAKATDGVYTLSSLRSNQSITVAFEKIEGVTYSGLVTDGTSGIAADIILVNTADGSAYYIGRAVAKRGFSFEVPAGTYEVRVQTEDGSWQTKTVTLTEDTEDEIVCAAQPTT